ADTTGLAPADAARLPALVAELSASIDALIAADLALSAKGLFSAGAAAALSKHTGGTLAIVKLPRAAGSSSQLFDLLFAALPPGPPFTSPEAIDAAFRSTFPPATLAFRTALDEAASGTGAFHNMLTGCDPSQPVPECRLGASDSFQTCHGCHTLDRAGNAEF